MKASGINLYKMAGRTSLSNSIEKIQSTNHVKDKDHEDFSFRSAYSIVQKSYHTRNGEALMFLPLNPQLIGEVVFTEREGFEPSVVVSTTPVFKTGAFNHSATSPLYFAINLLFLYYHISQLFQPNLRKMVYFFFA